MSNMQSTWQKGEAFENFVEKILFPLSHYDLIHRTNDYKQNFNRFSQNSLKPDFQFKSKLTGQIFYVEAKYRTNAFNGKYEVLSESQYDSFPSIHLDCPILVALGYGGNSDNPEFVSLLPMHIINSRYLSAESVYRYKVAKDLFPYLSLNSLVFETSEKEEHVSLEGTNINRYSRKEKKSKSKFLLGSLVCVLFILLSLYSFNSSEKMKPEDQLKDIVADYYQSMNSNNIDKLPSFLSQDVTYWYGAKNPTLSKIVNDAKSHRGKFPFSESKINWNSFKIVQQEDGSYYVSYNMIYKSKEKITDDYSIYNLKLITSWDSNFKLSSIREIRL